MTTKPSLFALALMGLVLLTACGDSSANGSGLDALPPTMTALPPSTPTDIPQQDPIQIAPVDWNQVDQFRAAMRPEFADDIDAFVNRNRYYIEASIVYEDGVAIIRGAERVRYTNRTGENLDRIVFRLYSNLAAMGGRMIVYRAFIGDELVYERPADPNADDPNLPDGYSNTVFILPLDTPLHPDDSVEMALEFSIGAERGMNAAYGQFGYQQEVFSGPEWYPVLAPYEEGLGWWQDRAPSDGDAAFIETGLYEIFLTTPENFVVAMSGSEIEAYPAGEGQMVHHYVSGPMRDSMLVASPNFGKLTEYVDDIAVNVFYWPGGESAAEWVMEIALDSVRAYNKNFGPYPYAELDVAETFNRSGIEYPGIVVITDSAWERGTPYLEVVVAHEIAHQWWYSLVGNNQVSHPWIDESLTAYSESVYASEVYGEQRTEEWQNNYRQAYNFYRGTGAPDLKLDLPVSAYTDNNYGMIIYRKGPVFYQELDRMLGHDVFLHALQTYFERYHYEVAYSCDVFNTFEEATGAELDEMFYEWVGNLPCLDPDVVARLQQDEAQDASN